MKFNRQKFIFQLKAAIELAYVDGITRILDYEVEEGLVTGRFLDGADLFRFKISAAGIEYKFIRPKRNDAYIVNYLRRALDIDESLVRFDSLEDWAAYLIRLD